MKKISWIIIPVAVVIFFLTRSGQSTGDYEKQISEYWESKHDFYRNSEASPFVQKKATYNEVAVFPADIKYKVNATLDKYTTREIVTIGNSDGTSTNYLKFAQAKFKIDGSEQELLILKVPGFGNQYLTAFGDETSGVSTYGGGRYLDLIIGKSDKVEIDFNKAYNPYCAYFEDFTCPLPPIENLLEIAIEAGEKVYPH